PHINLDSISDILLIINLLKYDFFRLPIYGGKSMAFYVEFITNFAARITVSSAHLRQREKYPQGNGETVTGFSNSATNTKSYVRKNIKIFIGDIAFNVHARCTCH
ncbi:MAG: hypothetical protein K2J05_06260, partial [Muribaculaceae bacterium]|nr:hypothetical protein [Muribaculaceae bacterium]